MQFSIELDDISSSLDRRALDCAARFRAVEAELLSLIVEIDRCRLFEKFGLTSTFAYCVRRLSLSRDVACNFIRVARACPELRAAVDGGMGISVARKIAAVADASNVGEWVRRAQTLTHAELEAALAGADPCPHKIRIGPEVLALLKRVQDLESQRTGSTVSADGALKTLLNAHLDRHDPLRQAERARPSSYDDGVERIPAAVLHQVNRRDQGRCQARLPDGSFCHETRWIHFHHIRPRAHGGAHTVENVMTVCAAHHRLWHARH